MEEVKNILRIHTSTWNVNSKPPPEDVSPLLGLQGRPDLVSVGLQEVHVDYADGWIDSLDIGILSEGYTKIRSVSMVGITLSVYALDRLHPQISDLSWTSVDAGLSYPEGHKGGNSLSFVLQGGRRLSFVAAHLTHAEKNLPVRVEDYHIVEDSRNPNKSQEDYTFWMGDFNFRLMDVDHLSATKIVEKLSRGEEDELLKMDELNHLKQLGQVFSGYQEMKINFKPTYRYYVGTSKYDLARRPAWTDRVLYRAAPGREITPLHYGSVTSLQLSDHQPVEACFLISLT